MKKLEMVIRLEKLEDLKQILNDLGVHGMTVSNVMGCGNQKGRKEVYRGTEMTINLLHKIKIEVVVIDEMLDDIVKKVKEGISTGKVGDGKIFIYNVENAIRIRTGEEGNKAI